MKKWIVSLVMTLAACWIVGNAKYEGGKTGYSFTVKNIVPNYASLVCLKIDEGMFDHDGNLHCNIWSNKENSKGILDFNSTKLF